MSLKKFIYILIFSILCVLVSSACKRLKLEDADKRFVKGEYYTAADMYRKIYRHTPPQKRDERGKVALRMAESYRLSNNPLRAKGAYANALRYKALDSVMALQYARTLHKTGDYADAAKQYDVFLKTYPDNRFAQNGKEGAKLAPDWKKNPTLYKVNKMDLFLSIRGGEFCPMLLPPDYEQVFFTSNRKEALGDAISNITGVKNNDIFMSRRDERGNWMKPEKVQSPVNTEADEGAVSFPASGNVMYYTYSPQDSVQLSSAFIYVATRSGAAWGKGEKVQIRKDTVSVFAHPAITPDGEYLYFVSDMPGGYGGKDIWRAKMIDQQHVDYIENLGPDINTSGDEMFPYMRDNQTLYFSSDGHVGMGGLDIYKAVYDNRTKHWLIENMKYPINSEGDDFGITFEGESEKGFFSSNRNDGRGWDHIYTFEYPAIKTTVEGYIVDTDDEFISNATIRVVGNDGTNKKLDGRVNGTYSMDVARGVSYVFLASAPDHLNSRMSLKTVSYEKDSVYLVDFVLTPIDKPVVLENIFYDFDKATLRPESKEALNGLIDLLKQNPNVTIELSAHTDRKGSEEYNLRLSQRRAESVVNYLTTNGIAADRLTAVGYGKTRPKVVTRSVVKKYDFLKEGDVLNEEFFEELEPEQQDMADQVNRRTEFKVLSTTYNLE